jgi:hypothetical protein
MVFYTNPEGFNIADVSDPHTPAFVGGYELDHAYNLDMQGPVAFVAAGINGLKIIDARNRSRPQLFGSTTDVSAVHDLVLEDYIVFIAASKNNLCIVDAIDVTTPSVISDLEIDVPEFYRDYAWISDLKKQDDFLYLTEKWTGLHVVDVSDVAAPIEIGKYEGVNAYKAVVVDGQYVYLGQFFGLDVVDISNPDNPVFVASASHQDDPYGMAKLDDIIVVSGINEVNFYNVADPSNPYLIESKLIPGFWNYSVAIDGDLIYVASEYGMSIFEAKLPTATDYEEESLPKKATLAQNRPNPFNPSTTIDYTITRRAQVRVMIYDILGREVAVLVDKEQPAGEYSITWNGLDRDGSRVASGIYFYQLWTDDEVRSRKMVMLK